MDTPLLPATPVPLGHPRATLTSMTGMDAGRVFAIDDAGARIGRDPRAEVCIEAMGLSRMHARVVRDARGSYRVEDLGSTNGTLVRGRRVTIAHLESGDYMQLGAAVLLRFALVDPADEALRRQLYDSSVRDPLTHLFNRRYFFERLAMELSHARRTSRSLSVLMIDIDHFKRLNDDLGHLPGDRALCFVAAEARRRLRGEDVLARYGGDEMIALSRASTHDEATRLAERARDAIAAFRFSVARAEVSITVSIGVASLCELAAEADALSLVALADDRLCDAKRAGRNRVCASGRVVSTQSWRNDATTPSRTTDVSRGR
jgi:diguanylate cyclase (GGDEF)-like protein